MRTDTSLFWLISSSATKDRVIPPALSTEVQWPFSTGPNMHQCQLSHASLKSGTRETIFHFLFWESLEVPAIHSSPVPLLSFRYWNHGYSPCNAHTICHISVPCPFPSSLNLLSSQLLGLQGEEQHSSVQVITMSYNSDDPSSHVLSMEEFAGIRSLEILWGRTCFTIFVL